MFTLFKIGINLPTFEKYDSESQYKKYISFRAIDCLHLHNVQIELICIVPFSVIESFKDSCFFFTGSFINKKKKNK